MLCFSADKMQNTSGIAVKKSKSGTKFRDDLKRLIAEHACKVFFFKKKRGGGTKGYFCLSGIALTSGSAAPPLARLLRVASAPHRDPPELRPCHPTCWEPCAAGLSEHSHWPLGCVREPLPREEEGAPWGVAAILGVEVLWWLEVLGLLGRCLVTRGSSAI